MLDAAGLCRRSYRNAFGADVLEDVPQLELLVEAGLAAAEEARIRLTEAGLERADIVGPWLYSAEVAARMEDYAWR
jgi:oxygen-independent coproporphyrinogen-3 oxidase